MYFTDKQLEIQRQANILHELNTRIGELECVNGVLADMTDTLAAIVTALTGTDDLARQQAIFDSVGQKPSDYCRELRRTIKHLADLQRRRLWTDLETINAAYRLIGEAPATAIEHASG